MTPANLTGASADDLKAELAGAVADAQQGVAQAERNIAALRLQLRDLMKLEPRREHFARRCDWRVEYRAWAKGRNDLFAAIGFQLVTIRSLKEILDSIENGRIGSSAVH